MAEVNKTATQVANLLSPQVKRAIAEERRAMSMLPHIPEERMMELVRLIYVEAYSRGYDDARRSQTYAGGLF